MNSFYLAGPCSHVPDTGSYFLFIPISLPYRISSNDFLARRFLLMFAVVLSCVSVHVAHGILTALTVANGP